MSKNDEVSGISFSLTGGRKPTTPGMYEMQAKPGYKELTQPAGTENKPACVQDTTGSLSETEIFEASGVFDVPEELTSDTEISQQNISAAIHKKWLKNPHIPDELGSFKASLLSLENFYKKLDSLRSRKAGAKAPGEDKSHSIGITGNPDNLTEKPKGSGVIGVAYPGSKPEPAKYSDDTKTASSPVPEKPALPGNSQPKDNPVPKDSPSAPAGKDVKEDGRTKEAVREKQNKANAEDDRKEKVQEKRAETAARIRDIDQKIDGVNQEISQLTAELDKLVEEHKDDPDFNPDPYLTEIFRKQLEMERLQTEKEQEKSKLEFMQSPGSSPAYEGEKSVSEEKRKLDDFKDTRYNVNESIRKNLEFIDTNPDDKRKAELLTDYETREKGLASSARLEDLRGSIRENLKIQ